MTLRRASIAVLLFLCTGFSQAASAQTDVTEDSAHLGVRIDPRDFGNGLRVRSVVPGSASEEAGIRAGDRIIEAAGKPIKTIGALRALVAQRTVGDHLSLHILRGEEKFELRAKLSPKRSPQEVLRAEWNGQRFPSATYFAIAPDRRETGSTETWTGKITIVEFWATWCRVCQKASARLEKMAKAHPDQLRVIAVSRESPQHLQAWQKDNKAAYEVVSDATESLSLELAIEVLPTFLVLDEEGVIRGAWVGYRELSEVETFIAVSIRLRERRKPASN